MTTQEALDLLAQVTGTINATRAQHEKIVQAINIVAESLKNQTPKKED